MKVFLLALLLISCGTDKESAPGPGPGPDNGKTSWQRVSQIHDQYCIQCHSNSSFIRSEALLKASTAKQRVNNGNMPQAPITMPDSVRREYLNFFF